MMAVASKNYDPLTMRHAHYLSFLAIIFCVACSRPQQVPIEMFFGVDDFCADSLVDSFPISYCTWVLSSDTALFPALWQNLVEKVSKTRTPQAIGCSPNTGKPLFVVSHTPRYLVYQFVDDKAEALFEHVQSCLPDYQVRIVASDIEGRNLLVEAYDDRMPSAWYSCAIDTFCATLIHAPRQAAIRDQLSSVVPVTFKARDGVALNAFLTLPQGLDVKNHPQLPAMVVPHPFDGPDDRWEYNPVVQCFASRGFAVLQVQFRSQKENRDEAQQQAIEDVRDGVAWLIESGIAHHRKVSYFVRDDLSYASADRMYHDPAVGKSVDRRHYAAFFSDVIRKASR